MSTMDPSVIMISSSSLSSSSSPSSPRDKLTKRCTPRQPSHPSLQQESPRSEGRKRRKRGSTRDVTLFIPILGGFVLVWISLTFVMYRSLHISRVGIVQRQATGLPPNHPETKESRHLRTETILEDPKKESKSGRHDVTTLHGNDLPIQNHTNIKMETLSHTEGSKFQNSSITTNKAQKNENNLIHIIHTRYSND